MQDADWKTDENVADLSCCIIIILIYGFEFDEEWNCVCFSQLLQAEESVLLNGVPLERFNLTLDLMSEKTQGNRQYSAK